jgi:hypothetical protein
VAAKASTSGVVPVNLTDQRGYKPDIPAPQRNLR